MADRVIRAEDNGQPLLDVDGQPLAELDVERVDEIEEAGVTVAELAAEQREWRFGHVIVDEAQDLTPMQWRMVARRAIGGSITIVGDLAQRSVGEAGDWTSRLPSGLPDVEFAELTVNYRSPQEVSDIAAGVLAELAPDLSAPRAIRSSGVEPRLHCVGTLADELSGIVSEVRRSTSEGRVAVIGFDLPVEGEIEGVHWLTPWQAKGLEFDSVVIAEPSRIAEENHGLSLLYVAITRATHGLVIVAEHPLPAVLEPFFTNPE